MRVATTIAGISFVLLTAGCHTAPARAHRPNVVVFLVDDLGWQDLSEPFHSERTPWNDRYHTPNVERLCRAGMKFPQAYAHTVCTPSRVSLMTGSAAARHGVTHWTLQRDTPTDREMKTLRRADWHVNGLSPDPSTPHSYTAPTLPQRLRDVGYQTILVGKAHFGAIDTPGAEPRHLGFDVNIAGHAAGAPSSHLAKSGFLREARDTIWQVPGLDTYHGQDLFLTDVLTTEALAAADVPRAAGQPFCLYLAHYAVHAPLDADERFVPQYRAAGLPEAEARYAALVHGMDASLGRVLDWLDQHHLADDTVIVFTSDNGGLSAHARSGPKHTHNAPLRSGKGSAYEGGVRVPLVFCWPGHVPANTTSPLPVQLEDLFPTLCELTGADPRCADGTSVAETVRGGEQPAHPLFWHHPHLWGADGPGIEPYSAVRDGDWKLIWFYTDGRAELYDLAHDLGEAHDLAAERPEIAAGLRKRLREQLAATHAQLPQRRDGAPLPMP